MEKTDLMRLMTRQVADKLAKATMPKGAVNDRSGVKLAQVIDLATERLKRRKTL
jgi:hypothetical protein